MHFILVIWIVVFSPSVKSQLTPSDSYSHSTMLQSGKILLYWKYTDSQITFEVIGQTTGWIGIGFSSNGAMTASDIVVGWVKNGAVTVTDRHGGSSNTYPPIDPQQNIEVLGGKELDGWTMIKFSRQIAACEEEYDREISTNTERLIWACGNTDPTGDDLVSGDYHNTDRGVESIYFFEPSTNFADLPTGPTYDTFDVLASNFLIPAERTYYNCILYKLPDFGGKQHIVKWEPVIQFGNEPYLHHMLIYRCGDIMENESELAKDDRCYSPNMAHFDTCTTIVFEWLLGAGAMTFPAEAGFPVGGPGDPVYVQLEIHYNNPNVVAGVCDNSGYRFTYTPTLRKYDVGVLQIGNYVNPKEHFIPPGAESFKSIAHCTNECVKSRMSVSETDHVTAFSVVLHSHEAGRKMRLRHLRNGTELPYLASDENYDFNYQEADI
uniref:DBH-like monooxygenase protein 1 homolog n=1 Tax=Styela clava TaxID=7725 RepID=UPI001939E20A|nr:DBH-like monooxygenase protein 1 homolog [Styela clava]